MRAMRRLKNELFTQLKYTIIFPFLLLTAIVAVVGSSVVFNLVARSLQERFDNQLAAVTRTTSDALLSQEQANLQFLREVAFAQRNDSTMAPGVAEALAADNSDGLRLALEPFFRVGTSRSGVRLDRLIAFDVNGLTMADFERPVNAAGDNYVTHEQLDLSSAWFTQRVLSGASDNQGDKYAGLIRFNDTDELYFASIAPVTSGEDVVGGIIVAMRVDSLLQTLLNRSQAAGVTLYDPSGLVIASSYTDAPAMSLELLREFENNTDPFTQSLFSIQTIDGRSFQFAYVPLVIRGTSVGILAPALSRDYVLDTWSDTLWPLLTVIFMLMVMIIAVGVWIARIITKPLDQLVRTAHIVTSGDIHSRANIRSENEIGILAVSFNRMADYLVQLYGQVQSDASSRAAILESITDGIVVCDDQGRILMANPATRQLMGIGDHDPLPPNLSDLGLVELTEGVPGFGAQRAQNMFSLGDYIVRVSLAPIVSAEGVRSGFVCVLQDMTEEVAVDRAKTNFIGTISHELRTPLTVIRGNSDLLLRGLAGDIGDEQRIFIDSIRQHATNMTTLIGNVIVIAGLDSGSLNTDLEPVELHRPVEEAVWQLQSQVKAKGLSLSQHVPDDLPPVLADFDQVRMVMSQLIDNAQRYTSEGVIEVRAVDQGDHVQVSVRDTGRGIPIDMHEQVFRRFIRGDGTSEGINSAERGIGLGLAICKQLIERHNGTIWVESTPGQGSTFFFTLRYADGTTSPEKSKTDLAAAA
jgi:signal transduction histidine kinase